MDISVDAIKSSKSVYSDNIGGGTGWQTLYNSKLKKGEKVYIKLNYCGDNAFYKIKARKVG